MKFLAMLFTWWNGTLGTLWYTLRKGTKVGEDEQGNVYYEGDGGRRWVIYKDYAEASAIPASWHGWMHFRTDTPPSKEDYQPRDWQKPHQPNMTGTSQAYFPKGSIANPVEKGEANEEYEAWSP